MWHGRRWLSLAALVAAASFLAGCEKSGPLTVPDSEAPKGASRAGVSSQPAAGGAQPAAPQPGKAEAAQPSAE